MSSEKIISVRAREILDSRGNPTLEVGVKTEQGVFYVGVPSGLSTGTYEAVEVRDGGERYGGKGVLKAVKNVNEIIAPELEGKSSFDQKGIDALLCELDGTENKSKLGANAIVGVSMAVCRAGASAKKLSLWEYIASLHNSQKFCTSIPQPCFNVVNGGVHAGNDLDIQEFMVVPQEENFSENLRAGTEIYHELKQIIQTHYGKTAGALGDEGGYAPPVHSPHEVLKFIEMAAEQCGYKAVTKIILDVAASQFFQKGEYRAKIGVFTTEGLSHFYLELLSHFPSIIGIEDPFAENDWKGWQVVSSMSKAQNSKLLIIGDDLLATNPKRIQEAYEKNACNAAIIKINQIGTVSEAIEAVKLAKSYGWRVVVSHRSGDTCDDFIADFAVGICADYIKFGAPARGERVAKYNRLLKIEEEMQNKQSL
jgi:enolase